MRYQVCTPSDIQLVAEIQKGATQAEAALYEKYSAKVYYLALKHSRSAQDAEDVQSETFLRVLQAIRGNRIRSAPALPAFVLGTTRNVLRELFSRRHQAGNNATDLGSLDLAVPPHEELFLDSEVRQAIQQTIVRLKPRERDLLRMHFYEELSPEEIAKRSGIARERVRLVKSRALQHFREAYARFQRSAKVKFVDTNQA
jgi:RNA polymerase sigma-70 factor (ECF subfamily)